MLDFVQTMKDWKRMCSAMEKLRPNDPCAGCRLEGYGCPAIYEDNSHVDFRYVEEQVSAWAAENPEPVYPTWGEWLNEQAVVIKIIDNGALIFEPDAKMRQPIPADIAERLGLKPKEGT